MAILNLNDNTIEVLEVVIEEETYKVPLGGSLPYKTLKNLKTEDDIIKIFTQYIPEDIFLGLPLKSVNQIILAWKNETEKANGKKLGE